jgi:thioredoxin reductase (NADPH)
MYDLVIIGAGSAGLTSAIYSARAGLNFVVLEQDGWGGGQITSAHMVENYPAVPNISGADLGDLMKEQAENLGATIELAIVENVVDKIDYKEIVLHNGDVIQTKAVICATGATPRKLGVDGEKEFIGKGVSYCAVCDGAFFANKDVFVIGGGDTAVEDAIYLSSICKSVTLVHRRDTFRAPKTRVEVLRKLSNVTIKYNTTLNAITGDDRVNGVDLKGENGIKHYDANGIFIAVGTVPATYYLKNLPLEFDGDYVVANETCVTNVNGIFVAGDIRKKQLHQVVTAVADGANSATSAINYLK